MTTLTIRDQSMTGNPLGELFLQIPSTKISVRELIKNRVFQEVKEANANVVAEFNSPSQVRTERGTHPAEAISPPMPPLTDWRVQFDKALTAFKTNRILILVDGDQVESLETELEVTASTEVNFLRLSMLMAE